MDGVDPYKVFGIDKNFTLDQLKTRFKKLILEHHPDKTMEIKSTPAFQILAGCYKMLLSELEMRKQDKQYMDLKANAQNYIEEQSRTRLQNKNMMPKNSGTSNNPSKKFDIEKFNQVFSSVRVKDIGDDGYEKWMNNPDSFKSKNVHALVKYVEPEPLIGSSKLGNFYELGKNKITDFSGDNMSVRNLNYTDYRVAHTTNALVDERVVGQRREYRTINELENDRANISFTMSPAELERYHMRLLEKQKADQQRMEAVARRDATIEQQFQRAHKLMLGR